MSGPIRGSSRRALFLAGALLSVLAIGIVDFVTGKDAGLALFYLLPIVAAGWWLGWLPATVVAVGAGACWLLADLAWPSPVSPAISVWNGVTRVAIFLAMGLVTARVRADRRRLVELTARLRRLVELESRLARTDPLTGLANSRAFLERLRTEVARASREDGLLCVAYVDFDNFKKVNDTYGHAAGDDLLREVARAMRGALRQTDVAARMGGDEFVLLLWNVSAEHAEAALSRFLDRVEQLGARYPGTAFGASIGVVHHRGSVDDEESLIRFAERAMRDAKAAGKGRIVVRLDDSAGSHVAPDREEEVPASGVFPCPPASPVPLRSVEAPVPADGLEAHQDADLPGKPPRGRRAWH